MIPQSIIDTLGLQNVRQLNEFDIFKTEVADWETEIGRITVMDTENGYPLRHGRLYFMMHHNGGIVYLVAPTEVIFDMPDLIISEFKQLIAS